MRTNTIHYSSIVRFSTGSNLNFPIHAIDSGHGSQVRDLNGDEVDGYDEGNANELSSGYTVLRISAVIFPLDYAQTGTILDDVRFLGFVP
jgi:hypothetical protein